MKNIIKNVALATFVLFALSACTQSASPDTPDVPEEDKIDDWAYDASVELDDERGFGNKLSQVTSAPMAMESAAVSGNLGFSVGGAKDIGNFRENIEKGFLPIPTDITYEGLFYDYFFETGQQEECQKLFCPSFSTAVSSDPFTNEEEYYLSVGLNSGIKEEDFERKKLNLVVVLDISGSMGSPFDQYYYDRFGKQIELEEDESSSKTKMEIASKSVVALMDHLEKDDQFGIVLFDDNSYVGKPISRVGSTDMQAIKDHVLEINDRGGTNMEAGMKEGTELFRELTEKNPEEYENRIIFITDAQPNIGDVSEEGLAGMTAKNAEKGIHTTFVGVGVDFNTELIELMTKVRGANYYSVHSEKQFKETMDENFDFMVTPLVFDLQLMVETDGYQIEKVFGSPEADEATGEIMYVNTLFPSKSEEGKVRGGVILLKLKKEKEGGTIKLKASYEDRSGRKDSEEKSINFKGEDEDYYDNLGIRKAIALTRHANVLKSWAIDSYREVEKPIPVDTCPPIIMYERGIIIPEPPHLPPCIIPSLGQWERQSQDLVVSKHYQEVFDEMGEYLSDELKTLKDEDMQQELDLLKKLAES